MTLRAEVAVVGVGPAGAVCAAILARRGYDVILVDNRRRRTDWLEVLSPEGTLALLRLGLPADELWEAGQPCLGIVDGWRSDAPLYTDFQLLHCSQGWVVERGGFDNLLIRFA